MMLPHVTVSRGPVASIWPHPLVAPKNNAKQCKSVVNCHVFAPCYYVQLQCSITQFAKKNTLLTSMHQQLTKHC